MKTFEELLSDSGLTDLDLDGVEISDYEIGERIQCFLNGYQLAENIHKRLINNISFQLNIKFVKGYQIKELIQFYNEQIGGFLDDLIY